MKDLLYWIIGFVLFIAVMYGIYWVAKTVSYSLFYEDMVEQTVKEMIKPEYLK